MCKNLKNYFNDRVDINFFLERSCLPPKRRFDGVARSPFVK